MINANHLSPFAPGNLDCFDGNHTIQSVRRDFSEWHLGRRRFAVWAIDVDQPAVRQKVCAAQQHLADFLHADYQRQAHVTLGICGFPSHNPSRPDEFGIKNLQAQLRALNRAKLKPFQIKMCALASFSSAAFFHVSDSSNSISALRRCLHVSNPGYSNKSYTPHVTIGLYAAAWPKQNVLAQLTRFPNCELTVGPIQRISLMSYDTSQIDGPLSTIADYHLDQAEFEWHETAAFAELNPLNND